MENTTHLVNQKLPVLSEEGGTRAQRLVGWCEAQILTPTKSRLPPTTPTQKPLTPNPSPFTLYPSPLTDLPLTPDPRPLTSDL